MRRNFSTTRKTLPIGWRDPLDRNLQHPNPSPPKRLRCFPYITCSTFLAGAAAEAAVETVAADAEFAIRETSNESAARTGAS